MSIRKNINHFEAPTFILGSHKSGTSLLRSLLDGHDELFVFPRETHFFQYSGHWVDYSFRRSKPFKQTKLSLLNSFIRYIESENSALNRYSDSPDVKGYDLHGFISCFQQYEPKTLREQFEVYLNSLHFALCGSHLSDDLKIVEKSVENAEYASVLRWMFSDSRFIHIVRDPYATLVAIRRSMAREHYPLMKNIARSLYNSYYYLFKNRIHLDRYLIIRFEDLITDTEVTVRRIADFVGIPFSEILLMPTVFGKLWKGNSTSDIQFSGISQAPLNAWKRYINDYEIHLTNRIAEPVFQEYGYNHLQPKSWSRRWVKGEKVKTYIKNRLLLTLF